MERVIKFRAWDGEYFKPLEDDRDYYFRDDGDGLRLYDKWGECKDVLLLQMTGLQDKNGKDIYEGDVLMHDDLKLVVEWIGAAWGYRNVMWPGTSEIIGNIYEHPELLTQLNKC